MPIQCATNFPSSVYSFVCETFTELNGEKNRNEEEEEEKEKEKEEVVCSSL